MTAYLITVTKENPRFGWADLDEQNREHYASKPVSPLYVMAEKLEREAQRRLDELFEDATRDTTSPWSDELIEAAGYHVRTCGWLAALRNERECTCMPDGSTTCEPCKVDAQIRYAYEKFINASDGDSSAVTEQDGKE